MRGINVTVIGQGIDHKGFGSKYTAAVSGTFVMLTLTLHFSVCHHLILTFFTMLFSPHFIHDSFLTALETLPQDSLVVLSDSRDVITNIHQAKFHNQNFNLYTALVQFRKRFNELTSSSGAIVVSTEAQCCVTALGHIRPGDLFAEDGTTTGRACSSGTPGCAWTGIESARLGMTSWKLVQASMARMK